LEPLKHKKRVSFQGDMNVLLVDNHGVPKGGGRGEILFLEIENHLNTM